MKDKKTESEEVTYSVFKVGEKEFLLPVEKVIEVLEISRVFPIPIAPTYISGVVPMRGSKVIPAIDLSKIYQTGELSLKNAKLVVVKAGNENIGFLSDIIPYMVSFSPDIPVDGLIDLKTFFETYKVTGPWHGRA
ncbi:MAG: chemotaxis protein CheW [Thermodesulfovibrionales bacterium]|nr:chemotaxis protein CheW [Thermodesulfovibrionales bacterium]